MEKLLKSVSSILKKYGKVNTYHSLLIIIILSIMGVFLKNQELIINKYIENMEKTHKAGLEYRRQMNPKISNILSRLVIDTGADDITLSELHNGESNAANGLPFLKFSMLYEENQPDMSPIADSYDKVNTSKYKILNGLFSGGIIYYNVNQDLQKLDLRMYCDMKDLGIKRVYLCPIYRVDHDLAFMWILFKKDNNLNEKEIQNKMFIASQQISALYNEYKK